MAKKEFASGVRATRSANPMDDILSAAREAADASAPSAAEAELHGRHVLRPAVRRKAERRTRRVQLTMRPNLYQDMAADADALGISVNEFIHRAVSHALGADWMEKPVED